MIDNKLAIICGFGDLPIVIAKNYDGEVHIICIEGEANPDLYKEYPCKIIPIGKIQKLLDYLIANKIKQIAILGKVGNKDLTKLMPDAQGALLLARILKNKFLGDDKILRVIAEFFEEKGLKLLSLKDIINLSNNSINDDTYNLHINISEAIIEDINLGFKLAQKLGELDIGQAVIIENFRVVGVEALEGTDELIKRCANLRINKEHSGILVKVMKPNQDSRMDIPAIGIDTIKLLAKHKYLGIAIELNKVIIINPGEVFRLAQKEGLIIYKINT